MSTTNLLNLVAGLEFHVVGEDAIKGVEQRLEGVNRRLEFLAAGEVARGLFELAERTSHFASNIINAATGAGLAAEALQQIQYAASQSGSSAEEVTGAMEHLTRSLYEAKSGSEGALKAFTDAGFTPEQVKGFRTSSEALAALSDRMAQINDPVKKQALAMQLLGRGNAALVEYLSLGSKAQQMLGKEGLELGAIIPEETLKRLKEVEDALGSVALIMRGFAATIASFVGPIVLGVTDNFKDFWKVNRGIIETSFYNYVLDFAYFAGFVTGMLKTLIGRFLEFISAHPEATRMLLGLAAAFRLAGPVASAFKDSLSLAAGTVTGAKWAFGALSSAVETFRIALLILRTDGLLALISALWAFAAPVLTVIGSFLLLVAVGLAVYAVVETLVEMFEFGKAFKDTTFGRMFYDAIDAIERFYRLTKNGVLKFFGVEAGWTNEGQTAATALPRSEERPPPVASMLGEQNSTQSLMSKVTAAPDFASSLSNLALGGTTSRDITDNSTTTIHAPMTINAAPGTDPKEIGVQVQGKLEDMLRSTARSTKGILAH